MAKRKPKRPATLLFAGPTGTGKTATDELLAELLTKHTRTTWGHLRVDMNQMDAAHTVSRLIGAPPGYVGYDGKLLFEPLMENPRHIILFDEMEKGHPKVLQVLMNAMSDGRLEASRPVGGKCVFDFKRCVLLFTSNVPLSVEEPEGMEQADITRACRKQLAKSTDSGPMMPPEIAARFTEILLYKELSEQDKVDIVALSMLRTAEQYDLVIRHIDTGLLQAAVDELDVSNGVRNVEYALDKLLGEPLAAFADSHDTHDAALSGDTHSIQVDPYI
jgi:ATP-dependent Clp protease ATP-binding subunit ClpB